MTTVAVIGSGISGMATAYLLSSRYDVTLYEKNKMVGGHTRTKTVQHKDKFISVDTGFIVFNHVNYPELTAMFNYLGVATHKSDMTFAFSMNNGSFEWGAANLNAVFGQRSNLFKPSFYRMIADVKKFFKVAPQSIDTSVELTLGELLRDLEMGEDFCNRFIIPMGAAIWSCPAQTMLGFPAKTFVQFFQNHGLLSLDGQHQWYTVTGGSQEYVKKITAPIMDKIKLDSAVERVWRQGDKLALQTHIGEKRHYDHVVLASHADESLAMLVDATPEEKNILGAFKYQKNLAYLHADKNQMPKRKACWASWNYNADTSNQVSLTYWMNLLQGIDTNYPLFVTLNPTAPIDPSLVFDQHWFTHPIFTQEAIAAQQRIADIQGKRNIWFCGAYQRYGFHEDGLMSAIAVAKQMGATIPWH
jgi:predicted NAD/FAD-binding protein